MRGNVCYNLQLKRISGIGSYNTYHHYFSGMCELCPTLKNAGPAKRILHHLPCEQHVLYLLPNDIEYNDR